MVHEHELRRSKDLSAGLIPARKGRRSFMGLFETTRGSHGFFRFLLVAALVLTGCAHSQPEPADEMPPEQVPIRLDLAERYLLESEPRMALEQLLLVKEQAGDNPRLHFNLGLTFSVMNELDRAAEAYRQAVTLKPSYGEAWNNLGQVEQARGNFDAAARAYETAVEQEEYMTPEFAAFNLGRLYAEQNDRASALDWLNRGMELNSRYIPPYLLSAEIYREDGNFKDSTEVLARGVRARPDSLKLRMELAGDFLRTDQEDRAKEQFRWIIEQQPESEEASRAADYLEMLR